MKICAFGDSVLKGIILDNNKYKISKNSFSNICKETLGLEIDNKAKFGSTISVGIKSVLKNIEQLKNQSFDYIILEFGGNDCDFNWKNISDNPEAEHSPNNTIESFREMYTQLINQIKIMNKKPILLSLPPIDPQRYFKSVSKSLKPDNILKWLKGNIEYISNWHERYNLEIFNLAINNNVAVIDISSKFLEQKNYNQYLCADGIHPNEKGHQIIAEAIKEYAKNKNLI